VSIICYQHAGRGPRTSTVSLNTRPQPFVHGAANKGWRQAWPDNVHLMRGLNVCEGQLTNYSASASAVQRQRRRSCCGLTSGVTHPFHPHPTLPHRGEAYSVHSPPSATESPNAFLKWPPPRPLGGEVSGGRYPNRRYLRYCRRPSR